MAAPLHVIGVSSPRSCLGSRRQRNATLIDGLLVRASPLGLGQGPADTLRQPGHGAHSIFVTWLEFRWYRPYSRWGHTHHSSSDRGPSKYRWLPRPDLP